MANIIYRDTNGTKSTLLPKASFGYDDYAAGGDEGRVYIGTENEGNIPLARKDEVDKNTLVNGTESYVRYDKALSVLDIVGMQYTDGNLSAVVYVGDDNSTVYFRDVLDYDNDGDLNTVKHFYETPDLVTQSGTTTLTYDANKNLLTASYTEV